MSAVQDLLAELKAAGWTKAAIKDELSVAYFTVSQWEKGRQPSNVVAVEAMLRQLTRRKRVPKKRRYS